VLADVGAGEQVRLQVGGAPQRGEAVVGALAEHRVVGRTPEVPRQQLRIGHEVAAVLDLAGGDAVALEGGYGGVGAPRRAPLAQPGVDLVGPGEAARRRPQRGVGGEVGDAPRDRVAEARPLLVAAARDGHLVLVTAAVDLVRAPLPERVDVAVRVRLAAVREVVEDRRPDDVRARLHLGDVDVLALAGPAARLDRGQDGDHGREPSGVVVEREAGTDVTAIRWVGEVREAAERVDRRRVRDHLRPRPLVAGPAHGHVHDARIPRPHRLVVEAPAGEHAGGEVLHQHVRLLDDLADCGERLLPLHVERDEPLRAVPAVEVREVGRVHQCRPLGRLEFEDVGAEVAEDAVGERPGEDPREVDDPEAGEGLAGGEGP
jgi:hypothetical protein